MLDAVTDARATTLRLQLQSVTFRYASGDAAVSDLSLDIGPGIVGLLGPNGAGKSTLMRMLATLSVPSSGVIRWNGKDIATDPDSLRRELGYLPQAFGVYEALSAREFLLYMAAVKGLPQKGMAARVDECLHLVGLSERAEARLGHISGGMRQRVGIAQALLNDPALLIVDEPTVGLDPEERMRFRNLLTDLAGQRVIVLSTHIVSDVEASATTLALLVKGRLQFHDTPEALIRSAIGKVWEWTVAASDLAHVRAGHHITASLRRPDGVRLRVVAGQAPSPDAETVMPTLDDAYAYALTLGGEPA